MTSAAGQATATAQPNIALVKYWGKRDAALNLPDAGSLSVTLDALHTLTTVRFDSALADDDILVNGARDAREAAKIGAFLDLFRTRARTRMRARVESTNDFPTGAGLASSASGFAALAVAADRALELNLDPRELSALARRGSGSAARSIFGGFVEMTAGARADGADACAAPLLPAGAWPLEVVVAVTSRGRKTTSSRAGMQQTKATSPFYRDWVATVNADLWDARRAVLAQDFAQLAAVAEASCFAMHALMLSARPALIYWNAATLDCIHCIRELRAAGTGVFVTIDAGPQVKAICLPGAGTAVAAALRGVRGVEAVLAGGLGEGARIVGNVA